MAPRTILAQLVVALKDDASRGAKALAGNLKDLEKSAVDFAKTMQGAKWGSAFTRDLGKLKATQEEIDKIKRSWGDLQGQLAGTKNATMRRDAARQWANEWRTNLQAVRIAQAQMTAESIADTRRRVAEEKRAAAASARDQLRIAKETAREKEKMAREASVAERAAAQESARTARDAARQQAQAARLAAREARSAERDARRAEREHGRGAGAIGRSIVRNTGAALGVGAGAYAGGRATRFTALSGADAARENYRQQTAGMSAEERAQLAETVDRLSQAYPSVNKVQGAEMGRGARNLTGTMAQGAALMPDLYRARVALQSAKGDDGAGELDSILKAGDIAGLQDNPERFRAFLNSYIRAAQVEDKQVSGRDYLSFYKRAKASGAGLSDEFISTTAPTLIQEFGGATAGTMLSTAYQGQIGDRITKRAMGAQQRLGIRDKNGRTVDRELFIKDPFAWSEKHLLPALQAKGVDTNDPVATNNEMSQYFSDRNAGEFFSKLINQRAQIARNKGLYERAAGLGAGDTAGTSDPYVAAQGLTGALSNLTAALTAPAMPLATQMLNSLSGGLNSLAKSLSDNPEIAKIAGLSVAATGGAVLAGAGIGALKGALPGGAGMIGGGLIGAGRTLPLLARGAGILGLGYGGYQVGSALGGGINAIGGVAAGENYRPKDAEGVFGLAERLGAVEREIGGIKDRTHPSRAGEPNADLSRLETEAADLRNRIASGAAGAGGEIVQQLAAEITAGRSTVEAAMEAVMEAARARARSGITVPLNVAPGGGATSDTPAVPARASGGSVAAGSLYRVNEYGEEFFQPTEDGRIIDPRRSATGEKMASRPVSISSPISINISGNADPSAVSAQVMRELETNFRSLARSAFADYGADLA